MKDLSPSSIKDFAVRMFTDKDLATLFYENRFRRNTYVDYSEVNQLEMYCSVATSEAHEYQECIKTGNMSAYGIDYDLFSSKAPQAIVDKIIADWTNYSKF